MNAIGGGNAEQQRAQLTNLLCGDGGLIDHLQAAFLFNFKTTRRFRTYYPWDYIRTLHDGWEYDIKHFPGENNLLLRGNLNVS
jgi:hypothetical protein